MNDLFDDDDSSSEEDAAPPNEQPASEPAAAAEAPPSDNVASPGPRRVIQEEEEDDSITDEPTDTNKPKESEAKEATFEEKTTEMDSTNGADATNTTTSELSTNKRLFDDSDDEDEEELKDDDVVGSSAPVHKETMEDVQDTPTTTVNRPVKKPRHLQVLESQRPPAGTTLFITKLPNLVGIQTEPFDENTYSASIEELERGDVHSTMIRWRYAKDDQGEYKRDENGHLIRESNARLVAWDDGNGGPKSYTLHVGTEVFEVDTNDSSSNGFAGLNGYLYLSQKATLPDEDHTPAGTVLESMGAIKSRLVARPSSLQSEAHKKLTLAVRQKTIKKARIAEYVTQEDPEKAKQERIKINADLDKAMVRKRQSTGSHRRPAMSRRFLEEEDDGNYDSVNIRAMKRGAFDEDVDYGEDSEEDEEEEDDSMFNRRRPTGGNRRASRQRQQQKEDEEDDEEDELIFEEESDEDEVKATTRKKLQHQALVDDDDDE